MLHGLGQNASRRSHGETTAVGTTVTISAEDAALLSEAHRETGAEARGFDPDHAAFSGKVN
jgi:hypothetical protein